MGLSMLYIDGQTPLDEDEKDGLLIKSITNREELDEFEQQNIEKAMEWVLTKHFKKEYILSKEFICMVHYKMFDEVWAWAGKFRKTNKNIGIDKHLISTSLQSLIDDCLFWIAHKTYKAEEIVIRFKHRLVSIHCFCNGNGRHARLIADIIINHIFKKPVFTWGSKSLNIKTNARISYIKAIKQADQGNIRPLMKFAKS